MVMTKGLRKRLLPLYVGAFLQGFVLWYPIEKVFMRSIGFNDATIGLMIAIYSSVMLMTETPAGVLADRWSRKGVLMVSSVVLAASALVGGLSYGVPMFMVCASLWGIFFAMHSGANDSIVYDMLEEEGHGPDLFDKAYGWVRSLDSAALVCGSLAGGLVAATLGLRLSFFLTMVPALLSIIALGRLHEPRLHKAGGPMPIVVQIKRTLGAVLGSRALLPVMVVLILTTVMQSMMLEFDQLWLIALHAPIFIYGPVNALLLAALGVGGALVQHVRRRRGLLYVVLACLAGGTAGLVFFHSLAAVVAAQFLAIAGAVTLEVLYTRKLHDALSSKVRSGASSAVSSIGRGVLIPLALVFGYVSDKASIFAAAWLLVAIVAGAVVTTLWRLEPQLSDGLQLRRVRE